MNGAIFFSGQYGSTAQYAAWIGEATGLPVFDVNDAGADPSHYDFLVLGSSVIVYKLTIRKWVRAHLARMQDKPVILFTVSGAPAGPRLDGWIAKSLPKSLVSRMSHVALLGRQRRADLSWWTKIILAIGAWMNDDPESRKQELHGFDFVDKASIEPVVKLIEKLQSQSAPSHQ